MPSIKQMAKLVDDDRFQEVFLAKRLEAISVRTSGGTKDRLRKLNERGVGVSYSEVAHIALQIGLYSLEETFGKE